MGQRVHDLTGQTFGKLAVVKRSALKGTGTSTNARWDCACDCGNQKIGVLGSNLLQGGVRSCGCIPRSAGSRHGHASHDSMTPTYGTWIAMKRRCEDPRTQQYRGYGARGIHVCESWHTFENFLADMGERPPGTTIDRIDVNGNYEPGNCRWATAKQQSANRRPVKPVIIRKLTDHQADELRRLRAEGYTYQSLGERFGIAMTTAYGYVNGRYDRPPKP